MEIVLCLFIVANVLLSDFMCKVIEYLYFIHSDLLIESQNFCSKSGYRRCFILCLLNIGWGVFLFQQDITSTEYLWLWLIILLLNMVIVTDYEQRLIFDRILLAIVIVVLVSGGGFDISLLSRLGGAVSGGVVMVLLAFLMRGTLGGGDIKLVTILGLWQGIEHLEIILFGGFLFGGLAALLLLLLRIKKRTDYFAYGPYFIFSAWINLF